MMKYKVSIHALLILAVLPFLAACAMKEPTLQSGPDVNVTSEGLVRVENSRVDDAFMRPDVDFTRFTGIMIDPLDVSNVKVIQPNTDSSINRPRKWELTDEDREFLQDIYLLKMDDYVVQRGGYTPIDEPAENVLRLSVALVKIAPNAPRPSETIGRNTTLTRGAGAISMAGVLFDAGTGQVIARFGDTRESSDEWRQNLEVSNIAEVRRIFDFWAQLFQYRLDTLNGKNQ
jgi:hypothetical protein